MGACGGMLAVAGALTDKAKCGGIPIKQCFPVCVHIHSLLQSLLLCLHLYYRHLHTLKRHLDHTGQF